MKVQKSTNLILVLSLMFTAHGWTADPVSAGSKPSEVLAKEISDELSSKKNSYEAEDSDALGSYAEDVTEKILETPQNTIQTTVWGVTGLYLYGELRHSLSQSVTTMKRAADTIRVTSQNEQFLTALSKFNSSIDDLGRTILQMRQSARELLNQELTGAAREFLKNKNWELTAQGEALAQTLGPTEAFKRIKEQFRAVETTYQQLRKIYSAKGGVSELLSAQTGNPAPLLPAYDEILESVPKNILKQARRFSSLELAAHVESLQRHIQGQVQLYEKKLQPPKTRLGRTWKKVVNYRVFFILGGVLAAQTGVSWYYDSQRKGYAESLRQQAIEKGLESHRVLQFVDGIYAPVFRTFISTWNKHPKLALYPCPLGNSSDAPDVEVTRATLARDVDLELIKNALELALYEVQAENKKKSQQDRVAITQEASNGSKVPTRDVFERANRLLLAALKSRVPTTFEAVDSDISVEFTDMFMAIYNQEAVPQSSDTPQNDKDSLMPPDDNDVDVDFGFGPNDK